MRQLLDVKCIDDKSRHSVLDKVNVWIINNKKRDEILHCLPLRFTLCSYGQETIVCRSLNKKYAIKITVRKPINISHALINKEMLIGNAGGVAIYKTRWLKELTTISSAYEAIIRFYKDGYDVTDCKFFNFGCTTNGTVLLLDQGAVNEIVLREIFPVGRGIIDARIPVVEYFDTFFNHNVRNFNRLIKCQIDIPSYSQYHIKMDRCWFDNETFKYYQLMKSYLEELYKEHQINVFLREFNDFARAIDNPFK